MPNTIATNATATLIEKKSKFIASIYKVTSPQEAVNIINSTKKEHKKATHNVYAYIIQDQDGQIISKYSDDKEPRGTAGRPILFLLNQNNLCNTLAIVTRYFGGTKLGKGGLIRAYTKSVKLAQEKTIIFNKTNHTRRANHVL
ncbi:MAG: YigZ family protein [Oscillospiraceae bacterium]|nr:YigZ family protein [Oscillospiraceae bacterium]